MSLVDLGAAFRRPVEVEVEPPPPPPPSMDEVIAAMLAALPDALRAVLADLPPPHVEVEPPDLAAIVTAVNGLKPGADADEIGRAVARELAPAVARDSSGSDAVLAEMVEALKNLDHRMKAVGAQAYGGGASELHHQSTGGSVATGVNNPLPITGSVDVAGAEIDQANSQIWSGASLLGSGGTFTGSYMPSASSMLVFAFSDTQLTTVQVRWSADGVSGRGGLLETSSLVTSEQVISGFYVYLLTSTTPVDRYYRLEVVNGGTAQSVGGECAVWTFPAGFSGSFSGLDAALSSLSTALLVRSVTAGVDPNGGFRNQRVGGPVTLTPTPSALGAAATYTSGWVATTGYVSVALLVATDQVSAAGGLQLQFSDDGSTVRRTVTRSFNASDAAAGSKFVTSPNQANYVRVVMQNGGTPQGSLFLGLRLNIVAEELARDSIAAELDESNTAIMVRGLLAAKNDSGTYGNITRGSSGGLRTSINQFETDVPVRSLTTYQTNQSNVSTTAVQIAGGALSSRKTILVKNLSDSTKTVFIGTSSAVTTSSGYELAAGEGVALDLGPSGTQVWAIAASGTQRVCWLEIA